jgi:hypothetical protein
MVRTVLSGLLCRLFNKPSRESKLSERTEQRRALSRDHTAVCSSLIRRSPLQVDIRSNKAVQDLCVQHWPPQTRAIVDAYASFAIARSYHVLSKSVGLGDEFSVRVPRSPSIDEQQQRSRQQRGVDTHLSHQHRRMYYVERTRAVKALSTRARRQPNLNGQLLTHAPMQSKNVRHRVVPFIADMGYLALQSEVYTEAFGIPHAEAPARGIYR